MEGIITLLPLLLIIVVMYMFLIRPQKKKERTIQAMRSSLQVGDKVVTIGGFRGTIVKTRDEILTLQLGADKNKVEIMRWGVSRVDEEAPGSREPLTAEPDDEETEEEPKKTLPKRMKKKTEPPEEVADAVRENPEAVAEEVIEEAEIEEEEK